MDNALVNDSMRSFVIFEALKQKIHAPPSWDTIFFLVSHPTHRNVRFGYRGFEEVALAAAAALLLLLLQLLLPARQPRVDRHEVGARPPRDEVRPHV